jgi:hypothetical protein
MLDKWDDLNDMIEKLDETFYNNIIDSSDLTIIEPEFWINKIKEIINN